MATHTITCEVEVAWWLRPYLNALEFFCDLTGCEPDGAKLAAVVERAVRVKVE